MRDVVLIGAAGAGKTTLANALLRAAGAAPASAPEPGRLGYGALVHEGARLSLLDPPGHPDLVGELHAGLRAASAVVLVVSPVQGVDARTVAVWEALEALPRLVVLTQLDRPGADADEAVAVCQRLLGETVLPLQLPLHDDDGSVGGLLDLLALRVSEPGGSRPPEPEHLPLVQGLRDELLEAVLTGSDDEQLFDRWLADDEPPPDVLAHELAAAVARCDVQPVVVAAPGRGVGVCDLLDLLVRALPDGALRPAPAVAHPDGSPAAPLAGDPAGPLVAEVLRPRGPALLRVWSGSLRAGTPVLVGADGPVAYAGSEGMPGDVCEAPDLPGVRPGTAVCDPRERLLLAPWPVPPAQLPVGVQPDVALAERVAEDPLARLEPEPRTGQLLLWVAGPAHAELLLQGRPSAPVVVPPGGPDVRLRIVVPDWCAGTVRSDLTGRGGQVLTTEQLEHGVVLQAALPPAEAVHYALALARASASTGSFERLD